MSFFKTLFGSNQSAANQQPDPNANAAQGASAAGSHSHSGITSSSATYTTSAGTYTLPAGTNAISISGMGIGGGGGGTYVGSQYTINSNGNMIWQPYQSGYSGTPLTAEESEELDRLEKERMAALKLKKIAIFKAVPATLRQQVVDQIYWKRAVGDIDGATEDKSQRQVELECKPFGYGGSGTIGGIYNGHIYTGTNYVNINSGYIIQNHILPNGLSEDELIAAHNEACLEKSITDEKT